MGEFVLHPNSGSKVHSRLFTTTDAKACPQIFVGRAVVGIALVFGVWIFWGVFTLLVRGFPPIELASFVVFCLMRGLVIKCALSCLFVYTGYIRHIAGTFKRLVSYRLFLVVGYWPNCV